MASTMALSIIASIITMGGFIFLTLITAITPREYGENMASITLSAAELLLHRLQALDVAYIFINSGTDYPPVIEAGKGPGDRQRYRS